MIKVFFAGDFCCCPSTQAVQVSQDLKDVIHSADIKVINFETPLKPDTVPAKDGLLYNNDDAPSFLIDLGFDTFPLANNHIFDYGIEGYNKTAAALDGRVFGVGDYEDAYKVYKKTIDGITFGFISLCFSANNGVFDSYPYYNGQQKGCAWINDPIVNHVMLSVRKQVDYLIVLPHDGIEYIDVPIPETISRYRDFIDFGADAVIASHPHCPQGYEIYRGKPICYSLGNFFFNSKYDYSYRAVNRPHWYEGLCVMLTFNGSEIIPDFYFTKNVDNVSIELDLKEERHLQFDTVCNYLKDRNKYDEYYWSLNPMYNSEIAVVEKFVIKRFIKKIAPSSIMKKISNAEFYRLLSNDTRRHFFLRYLRHDNDKYD